MKKSGSQNSSESEDDKVYVAVGKVLEENKVNVKWALENFGGKEICFLHVLAPPYSGSLDDGRTEAAKALDCYIELCQKHGSRAQASCIEGETIQEGIITVVSQKKIRRLVMGAVEPKKYRNNMKDIKSQKAIFVFLRAPTFCHITFICQGNLVCARAGVDPKSTLSTSSSSSSSNSDKRKTRHVREDMHDSSSGNSTPNKTKGTGSEEFDMVSKTDRVAIDAEVDDGDHDRQNFPLSVASDHFNRALEKVDSLRMDIVEAILQGKATENLQHEERRRRKEVEREMETCKKERDELLRELDNSKSEIKSLKSQLAQKNPSKTYTWAEFSIPEIAEATSNFNSSMIIGQGGYGNTYKGLLRHTKVAIKVPKKGSSQGTKEFFQEVEVLSRLRHPNIVTLIGVCSEAYSLIYEYAANGSLEDRLNCKGGSRPLPWQARARIARELCRVLIFLQSSQPESIIHGDLKPDNILLDANLSCKLSDFGICRGIKSVDVNSTMLHMTGPMGTMGYIDPLFLSTGLLSPKSDVYSYGILVLRMLTLKLPMNIKKEVQVAFDKGNLRDVLDTSAGEWPSELATSIVELALRCCEMNRKDRPNIATVWETWNQF